MMKSGRSAQTEFWQSTYRTYIRTITFQNDLSNLPNSCTEETLCWDVSYSASQKKKVYAYLIDSGLKDGTDTTKILYNLYIVSDASIFAPPNCSEMFSMFTNNISMENNLLSINFNDNFNTSKVKDMSSMFEGSSFLTTLYLDDFNTNDVEKMNSMFRNCKALTNLDLSSFNTSKVTDMSDMFSYSSSLTNLDLSSFNTLNVTNMSWMFRDCNSLVKLNLNSFNTSNVTNMSIMFWGCLKIQTQINIMNTGTTSYSNMFTNALTDPDTYVILGYTTDTQSIAEAMKATASSTYQSKITLKQI